MTSPSMSKPGWSPARPASPARSPLAAMSYSAPPAALPAAPAVHDVEDRADPEPALPPGLLHAARAASATGPGLHKDYMAHRPNVERAIAQVATWRGRRVKLRYRGVTKNNAWLKRRTAALNLRSLASRGLTRHDEVPGSWPPDQPGPGQPLSPKPGTSGRDSHGQSRKACWPGSRPGSTATTLGRRQLQTGLIQRAPRTPRLPSAVVMQQSLSCGAKGTGDRRV